MGPSEDTRQCPGAAGQPSDTPTFYSLLIPVWHQMLPVWPQVTPGEAGPEACAVLGPARGVLSRCPFPAAASCCERRPPALGCCSPVQSSPSHLSARPCHTCAVHSSWSGWGRPHRLSFRHPRPLTGTGETAYVEQARGPGSVQTLGTRAGRRFLSGHPQQGRAPPPVPAAPGATGVLGFLGLETTRERPAWPPAPTGRARGSGVPWEMLPATLPVLLSPLVSAGSLLPGVAVGRGPWGGG